MWPFRRRSRTTAPTSEALDHVLGREYAAGVPYMLPKDMEEVDRLDFQHYMLRYALRGNYAAPLTDARDILDVGTGTGRWAAEMAELFPQARITGVDIMPPAALEGHAPLRMPANYSFVAANVLEGLPFPDASFDFVHQRLLYGALPADRWQAVVNELVRVTRAGGWIELVEGGLVQQGGSAMNTLNTLMSEASMRRGIDVTAGSRIGSFLQAAGALGVAQHSLNLPMGKHGGRIGTLVETDALSVFKGFQARMVAAGIVDEARYNAMLEGVRHEAATLLMVWPIYIAYGQRPL
ncbi:MAG TPA: methyltransferase domain-containing protein [Ktedonobacterales bacterium]|nr:methyltransferase domain-containing protein [Ktedonobacterales bacterium]